jgi:HK97 family phage major capsid protein
MNTHMKVLIERRTKLRTDAKALLDAAEAEKRDLTADEQSRFDGLMADIQAVTGNLERAEQFEADERAAEHALDHLGNGKKPEARGGDFVNLATGAPAAVRSGESFAEHATVKAARSQAQAQEQAAIATHGNLCNQLRAISLTGGQAVVPQVWASQLIDLARNKSAVLQAGAQIVPMEASVVKIGRLTGDPTAAFRVENSLITPSDPTLDNVTLTAQTMSCEVIGSMEWFQDSLHGDEIIRNAIAQAMASRLDLVALYGGITAGAGAINLATPPNPRGVLATLNAVLPGNVLGGAANGTTQTAATYFNEVLDTIYKVRYGNEEPNALIWNAKVARQYAGANDTTGQPLRLPADVEGIPRYMSNQVPSYTQGTMTNRATDLFVGDFTQLLIGQRLDLSIQVLTERYADYGQIAILAHWRGDVAPARPAAFSVYRGIQGAV